MTSELSTTVKMLNIICIVFVWTCLAQAQHKEDMVEMMPGISAYLQQSNRLMERKRPFRVPVRTQEEIHTRIASFPSRGVSISNKDFGNSARETLPVLSNPNPIPVFFPGSNGNPGFPERTESQPNTFPGFVPPGGVLPDSPPGREIQPETFPREGRPDTAIDFVDDSNGNSKAALPDDLDMEKLDMDYQVMLSNAASIEDFAKMFDLDLPAPLTQNSSQFDRGSISARFGGTPGEVLNAVQATCEPEVQTVSLNLPEEPNVVYFPQCVRLQRCGGCCMGALLECHPTHSQPVQIQVLRVAMATMSRTRSSGTDRGRTRPGSEGRDGSARRRRQVNQYVTIKEQNHTECSCQCRVQEHHCHPQLQEYIPHDCRCACKNTEEQSKCESRSATHYWDNEACQCYCLKTVSCSVTLTFDHTTCSCVHVADPLPGITDGRVRRERPQVVFGVAT